MPVLTTDDAWTQTCVLCAARKPPVTTALDDGHCCDGCRAWLGRSLSEILRLAADAAAWVTRRSTGTASGSPAFASRPPIDVEAIDPELALIELNPGDKASAVTILEMLEMWERCVREDRALAPYGAASEQRVMLGQATLTGVTGFLATQLDWITTEPTFGLEDFADQVRRAVAILRRWDTNRELSGSRYRVPCPALIEHGETIIECGRPLVVNAAETTYCRGCGTEWPTTRLLAVAGRDADIWLDAEAVSEHLGIPERTVRHWGKVGKVARRGMLYRLSDITRHADAQRA